jgi:RHS repeat-associated protein
LQSTFDRDGNRLVRVGVVLNVTTHFVGDTYENQQSVTNGPWTPTIYYLFGGIPVAMKQGSTLSYLHHDHLGSLVSATNASGTEIGSARYFPYGAQRPAGATGTNPSGLPSDRLFTGQTRDLGNDAYYFFRSRYYDATIGRFHIPDSVVPGAGNPQALNRYAYALNNPMRLNDPSGHRYNDPSDGTFTYQPDLYQGMPSSIIGTASDKAGDVSGPAIYHAAVAYNVQSGGDPHLIESARTSLPLALPKWVKRPQTEIEQPAIVSVMDWFVGGYNGAAFVTVTDQRSANGRSIQIALSAQGTDTSVSPYVSGRGGTGDAAYSIPPSPMLQSRGTYLSAGGFTFADYTASLNVPAQMGTPLQLTVTVNPFADGGYRVTSLNSRGVVDLGFNVPLEFTLP